MNRLTLCLIALCVGCAGSPDPRRADVLVKDAALREPAAAAVSFWSSAAPGQLDVRFGECSTDPDRTCMHVVGPGASESVAGEVARADGVTSIFVFDVPADELVETVTHELGHAFGLRHVDDPSDVMRADGFGHYCTGPATRQRWSAEYGDPLREECR